MEGKRGLILGLANNYSIAWGIAQALAAQGAKLAFSYPNEAMQKRVVPLAAQVGSELTYPCDVGKPGDIEAMFRSLSTEWPTLDFVVHAVAFSDKDELRGKYVETTRENFLQTMDISCYSFTEVARHAAAMMPHGGSLLTLTYLGAQKVIPHYNVMGLAKAALEMSVRYLAVDLGGSAIRVNAISAGPIKTLAASGIGDFKYILKWNQYNAPLEKNVSIEEVGKSALYFLSDLSSGVTGEVHFVDAGFNVIGMKKVDSPDMEKEHGNH